jgi:hypothetical protein
LYTTFDEGRVALSFGVPQHTIGFRFVAMAYRTTKIASHNQDLPEIGSSADSRTTIHDNQTSSIFGKSGTTLCSVLSQSMFLQKAQSR